MDYKQTAKKTGSSLLIKYFGITTIGIFLIIIILGVFLGLTMEHEKKEQEERENATSSEYTINGGVINNPRSNYADNEIPLEFKELYKEIAKKYNIEWELLAGIHRVETAFSSNVAVSSAGAIGHTQFMKCTWAGWGYAGCSGGLGNADIPKEIYTDLDMIKKYNGEGVDGNGNGKADPLEISDSLSATAKKLEKDGANRSISSAIFSYNHSQEYVSDVTKHYNAYKSNPKWVKAGIPNVKDLGKANGKGDSSKGFNLDNSKFGKPKNAKEYTYNPSYPWGQCTWYVHQRRHEIGKDVSLLLGNGGDWDNNAKALGMKVGKEPKAGSAVAFDQGVLGASPQYGHIAFVEKVEKDGSIVISESNVEGLGVISMRKIPKLDVGKLHYIYD